MTPLMMGSEARSGGWRQSAVSESVSAAGLACREEPDGDPIQVVRRFCAAWSDDVGAAELAACFADNAVYHNIPLAPVTGRQAIENNIATFIRPGAPGIESLALRLINIVAEGPMVMTERVDVASSRRAAAGAHPIRSSLQPWHATSESKLLGSP